MIIKVLGALVLLWGLWELFAATATLVRGPGSTALAALDSRLCRLIITDKEALL